MSEGTSGRLEKANRLLRLKTMCVVREVYRREDVPCHSPLCLSGCQPNADPRCLLPDGEEATHYVMPDPRVAREYLELLEDPHICGIIFTQTVVHSVQHDGSRRLHNRLKAIVKDRRRQSMIFHNEFQTYANCDRQLGEPVEKWHTRATYHATDWYFNHLAGAMPIVMLTSDEQFIKEYKSRTVNVFVLTMAEYLRLFWETAIPGVMDVYQSITDSLNAKTKASDFVGYVPLDVVTAGIKYGKYIQGFLQVNKGNASQEAFVRRSRVDMKEESGSDILVPGSAARNRGVHGDLVAVEILPKSEWRGRSLLIRDTSTQEKSQDGKKEDDGSEEDQTTDVMPTGRVVAVIQRNWREYVACFSKDEESGRGGGKAGKVLVIPWDFRIPKVRISTRQVDSLRDHRIIVRIDHWEPGSQYPNGHFVKSLGKIGELETEVAAILVENNITVPPFSEAQMKELPVDTWDSPWTISPMEAESRRDLRQSHLVFSIDPKGCEDVDDTLSVRNLSNGNTELGVHIADVTHFVPPGSLSDIEAQCRSTTVYLADRRYDMLPEILSAHLCSLVSGVDRYAVSAIWELDREYEVVNVWFGRTIIRSRYKMFYEMAQAMHDGTTEREIVDNVPELDGLKGDELHKRIDELRCAIDQLMEIARRLKSRRVSGGALELESVEVQIQLSETKSIENLTPKDHLEIHDTIAECMIFANHWVAKKITGSFPNQALLRCHPLPREEQFNSLRTCAAARKFEIHTSSNKALAESLDMCVDRTDPVVNKLLRTLATQAMSNAEYFCTGVIPRDQFFHYGLALNMYTHFTSPIRRYADIVVHRQLMAAVAKDPVTLPTSTELDDLSQHINKKHRASQYAQRESQELFQCLYFRGRGIEEENSIVDAVIFQIRANGLFVFVPRYGIKGPVYLRSKDGQVLYITGSDITEWTGGTIARADTSVTISCLYGEQTYTLLDHITVKLSLNDSWAHASSLKLELLSNKPHKLPTVATDDVAKQQKAAIIKEVSTAAVEKRLLSESHDLGAEFEKLKQDYGQTSPESSLYNMFESFKETALAVNR